MSNETFIFCTKETYDKAFEELTKLQDKLEVLNEINNSFEILFINCEIEEPKMNDNFEFKINQIDYINFKKYYNQILNKYNSQNFYCKQLNIVSEFNSIISDSDKLEQYFEQKSTENRKRKLDEIEAELDMRNVKPKLSDDN